MKFNLLIIFNFTLLLNSRALYGVFVKKYVVVKTSCTQLSILMAIIETCGLVVFFNLYN